MQIIIITNKTRRIRIPDFIARLICNCLELRWDEPFPIMKDWGNGFYPQNPTAGHCPNCNRKYIVSNKEGRVAV